MSLVNDNIWSEVDNVVYQVSLRNVINKIQDVVQWCVRYTDVTEVCVCVVLLGNCSLCC